MGRKCLVGFLIKYLSFYPIIFVLGGFNFCFRMMYLTDEIVQILIVVSFCKIFQRKLPNRLSFKNLDVSKIGSSNESNQLFGFFTHPCIHFNGKQVKRVSRATSPLKLWMTHYGLMQGYKQQDRHKKVSKRILASYLWN